MESNDSLSETTKTMSCAGQSTPKPTSLSCVTGSETTSYFSLSFSLLVSLSLAATKHRYECTVPYQMLLLLDSSDTYLGGLEHKTGHGVISPS